MKHLRKLYTRSWAVMAMSLAGIGMLALVGTGPAMANGLGAGIVGSPHDFSSATWNFRGEICRVCHVPHDHRIAEKLYMNGLLWNHQVSAATYTMYDSTWSSTLDNGQSAQPDGTAKLCLGCHDGTVAIDQFDKNFDGLFQPGGPTIVDFAAGDFLVPGFDDGTNKDLRGTHPLSITYDETVDTSLHAKTDSMGTSGTIEDVLDGGKVQCSSCHDVHDQESVAATHLLRVSQTAPASGLCLTCHIK